VFGTTSDRLSGVTITVAGVRVAFVGKGGAGKSSIAGTFARLLAGTGQPVLALDSDPMPGLAFSVGVANIDAGVPDEAVEEYDDDGRRRYRLRAGLTASDVVEQYAVRGPDGVRFLQLGKARGPRWDNARQHAAFHRVVDELPVDGWNLVGDLPAGTRQAFQGWGRYAHTLLVVVEPTASSILSGRRLARLAQMSGAPRVLLVASQVRGPADAQDVAARTGLLLLGAVPYDPLLGEAARSGCAPLDYDPDAPAVRAVASLVEFLVAERRHT